MTTVPIDINDQANETETLTNKTLISPIITPNILSGSNTFTLPSSSGQLALISDVPSVTNFVTTNTNQTITGNKTFSQAALLMTDGSARAATFAVSALSGNWIYTFPNKTGTIAMLSDITAGGAQLNIPQTWTALQTFGSNLAATSIQNTGTLTLPTSTDTLVGRATTDILSNKSLSNPTFNLNTFLNASGNVITVPSAAQNDVLVGRASTDTITGQKTFTNTVLLNDPVISASTYLGNSFQDAVAAVNDPVSTGTISQLSFNYLGQKTVSATSATTYTNASTLHITGAPVASTNVTITTPNAIQVDVGNVRMTNGRLLSTALGTAAAPALAIGAALNDGIYSSAAGNVNITAGGTLRTTINSTNVLSTVRFQGPIGTVSAVAFGCNAANTGMYGPAASQIALACNGTQTFFQTATQTNLPIAGTAAAPSLYFSTDTTSGVYRSAANQVAVACSAAQVANFTSTGLTVTGKTTTSTLQVGTPGTTTNCIQTGSFTFVSPTLTAGCVTAPTTTITFATAFSSTPNVVAMVANPGGVGTALNCLIVSSWNVSTTGFTLGITNAHPSANGSGSPTISWFAWN